MARSEPAERAGVPDESRRLFVLFEGLTVKQHEVFELVSENRTSKEIAARLGITESAVNQRIEAVRSRAGSLPRAHIARDYRHFRSTRSPEWVRGPLSMHEGQLHDRGERRDTTPSGAQVPRPEVTDDNPLHRVLIMVMIAVGLMAVSAGALAITHVLTNLM